MKLNEREWAVIVRDGTLELVKLDVGTEVSVSRTITLEYMQGVVKGNIELVDRIMVQGVELDVWGNDEAKLIGMPFNVVRRDGEMLCGPLLILASDRDGNSLPLTITEAERVEIQVHLIGGLGVSLLHIREDA